VDRLGERLRRSDHIGEDDLRLLQLFRQEHADALRLVQETITGLLGGGVAQTSRIKTIQTIHDKLRREPTKLSRVQDIAGVRIVKDMDRIEQDQIVRSLAGAFPGAKVKDRRHDPSYGYRAVHVIVRSGRCAVEVQVRTRAQDLWAQSVERLGDVWGRQIRYGEPPNDPDRDIRGITRADLWALIQQWSPVIAQFEDAIADYNVIQGRDGEGAAPFDAAEVRRKMHDALASLVQFVERGQDL
jgi:hypothetical protein